MTGRDPPLDGWRGVALDLSVSSDTDSDTRSVSDERREAPEARGVWSEAIDVSTMLGTVGDDLSPVQPAPAPAERSEPREEPIPPVMAPGEDRYTLQRLVGRGGQGEVWQARDEKLGMVVAVKVLRPKRSARDRRALELECSLTASLVHPGIPPVVDRGETADGRPWFAMKFVAGRDLRTIMDDWHAGTDEGQPWTLRRLVDVMVRVCDAVSYAHGQGVMHLDLKPRNIMIGAFGEVLVMDWGLARKIVEPGGAPSLGLVAGTPGYVPPERYIDPHAIDPATDVYALGAMLYRLLTGRKPRRRHSPLETLRWAERRTEGPLPAELRELAESALAYTRGARLQTVVAFRRALVDWLDGARQREKALALVARAQERAAALMAMSDEVQRARAAADAALAEVPPHTKAEAKRAAWRLADAAEAQDEALALAELDFEQTLRAALTRVPALPEAEGMLADHYRRLLIRAEQARDRVAARRFEVLLRTYDDGRHAEWLDGEGALTLVTDPPGAQATIYRFELRDRRLVAVDPRPLGPTPIDGVAVGRGSHLVVIEAPGRAPTRYPVHIGRDAPWTGRPPTHDAAEPIPLLPAADLGPDEHYVPAGWCIVGGDPQAPDPLPRQRLWVDGFVARRHPVTHRAYLAFIQDLVDRGDRAAAERHQPGRLGPLVDHAPLYRIDAEGRVHLGRTLDDEPIDPDTAVTLVDWHGAQAFARWTAERTSLPWRLPHDLEWEKAARGVDGRWLPWGDHLEPSWAAVLEAFARRPGPRAVGAVPEDVSVYGLQDLVGTVREWCCSDYVRGGPNTSRLVLAEPSGPFRMVRGGGWSSRALFGRPAGRFASRPDERFRVLGFRLVRSLG